MAYNGRTCEGLRDGEDKKEPCCVWQMNVTWICGVRNSKMNENTCSVRNSGRVSGSESMANSAWSAPEMRASGSDGSAAITAPSASFSPAVYSLIWIHMIMKFGTLWAAISRVSDKWLEGQPPL